MSTLLNEFNELDTASRKHSMGIPSQRYRDWATVLKTNEKVFVKTLLMYTDPTTYEILFSH